MLHTQGTATLNKPSVNTKSMDSVKLTTTPVQYMAVFLNRNVITVRPYI